MVRENKSNNWVCYHDMFIVKHFSMSLFKASLDPILSVGDKREIIILCIWSFGKKERKNRVYTY